MKRNLLLAVTFISVLAGCSRETELQRTIFIEDPDSPGLPQYSEWGYNTFGAYYDRIPFVSTDDYVPARFIVDEQSTTFQLDGVKKQSPFGAVGEHYILSFTLPDIDPEEYDDLL